MVSLFIMANITNYDQDLEDRILNIVRKVQKNRNRACLDNIYTFFVRGGKVIEKGDVHLFLQGLLENDMLIDIGGKKESFKVKDVVAEKNSIDFIIKSPLSTISLNDVDENVCSEIIMSPLPTEIGPECPDTISLNSTQNGEGEEVCITDIFKTIDDKFFDILLGKIDIH